MSLWRRLFGDRPIVTRLVAAVAATMTVVLLVAGAFVFWRVEFALNRQLNQDLNAYHAVVIRDLATGDTPPTDTPGQSYQVYDGRGRIIGGDAANAVGRPRDRRAEQCRCRHPAGRRQHDPAIRPPLPRHHLPGEDSWRPGGRGVGHLPTQARRSLA